MAFNTTPLGATEIVTFQKIYRVQGKLYPRAGTRLHARCSFVWVAGNPHWVTGGFLQFLLTTSYHWRYHYSATLLFKVLLLSVFKKYRGCYFFCL